MPVLLEPAKEADASAIASLRLAVARRLTELYGRGTWSFAAESEAGVRLDIASTHVFVGRQDGVVVATLRLSPRQPWIGDYDFFTPAESPLFLTSMAVSPKHQRLGIGRACLEEVGRVAMMLNSDTVRLDAYDAPAGAGEFYRKCGYTEVRRAAYNGTPLVFFERRVA